MLIGFVGLVIATAALMVVDQGGEASAPEFGSPGPLIIVLIALPGATFYGVGMLLISRRAQPVIGWMCLAIGMSWLVVAATSVATEWAFHAGRMSAAEWFGVIGSLWVPALGLMATHLLLRLPGGALLSPGWRWYSRLCTLVIVLVSLGVLTEPGLVSGVPGTENPLGAPWLRVLSPLFVLLPISFLGAIGSLVVRYKRAGGRERLQIRVIALGGAVFFLVVCISGLLSAVGLVVEGSSLGGTLQNLALLAYNAVPVAIGISVLRYRLYEIDVVINRALVYAALTATLVVAYVSAVLLLRLVFDPLIQNSDLAVAGSTLAVAALFRPARDRIQSAVDRRFYRSRYDAAQTLADFGSRLREQLDLEALSADLQVVVRRTVQPAHLSLWLRAER